MARDPLERLREEAPVVNPTPKVASVNGGLTLQLMAASEKGAKIRGDRWLNRNATLDVMTELEHTSTTQEPGMSNTYMVRYE